MSSRKKDVRDINITLFIMKQNVETDSPPVVLIPPSNVNCASRWVNSTVNHRITNLIIGAIGKVRPEESCHACHMRASLLFSNTEVKLSNNIERHTQN
jgi:hypothetical protein